MSHFQILVTPPRLQTKKLREPTEVFMAPFSAKSIVQFEDVPVTKTAKRTLRVVNPSENAIEVKVTKSIKPEHNISLEWSEVSIAAHGQCNMEIVWSPIMEVTCTETMQLTDSRNFRKDVMIILKSKNNKPSKNIRKYPSISSGVSSKSRMKSPLKSNLQLQQRKRPQKPEKTVKETVQKQIWKGPSTANARIEAQSSVGIRRSVNTLPLSEHNVRERNIQLPNYLTPSKRKLKENISPRTPEDVLSLIDNLKFTPATDSKWQPYCDNEKLASWPTPVANVLYKTSPVNRNSIVDVRPRRLTDEELTAQIPANSIPTMKVEQISIPDQTIFSNKTFEVNHTENALFETSSLDISDVPTNVDVAMNKTTTILSTPHVRQLEIIQEEDAADSTHIDKNATQIVKSENLKRDVQLVCTPLRKYAESMDNLSINSTSSQNKFAIQGSLPNLNDLESIRSIEQNRYFYKKSVSRYNGDMSVIKEQKSPQPPAMDTTTVVGHTEFLFNHSEILAQSSRFNINEVGLKSFVCSPVNAEDSTGWIGEAATKLDPAPEHEKMIANKKRKSNDGCDSPGTESCTKTFDKSDFFIMSPPKRQRIEPEFVFQCPTPTNASAAARFKNWSQNQRKNSRFSNTMSLAIATPRKTKLEPRIKLYDTDSFLHSFINHDPFAATTTCDPFLASTMYLDEQAVENHQIDFKKWLNALVTIPAELDSDCNAKIDVGKLFTEVRHKELTLAPTKEVQSMSYFTKYRMESLRRAAVELYFSDEMRIPCSKVVAYVNKNSIRIRSDRNLHLDMVMQRYILELLLCFNPLWLRLGLEVVYGEQIHLQSNNDIVGLSTFIINRLFRDKSLEQKYTRAFKLSDEYSDLIKKFTLQKILLLLLFLDKAKTKGIVKHNPCLFVKKSPHKETKDILLKFSSELLANIGDITRELKRFGYVLQHKQKFLDEFDYAFTNLAVDLRDGIRLTRIMEIILLRDDLSKQLRVPAISRLQRIHNVKLALNALVEAEFHLKGDIAANDIADGHREKTLSLLWQIIYKFRAPKFHAAAVILQKWWRHKLLRVFIQRRIRQKEQMRREVAATRIQAAFRGFVARKFAKVYLEERTAAALVLQRCMRRFLAMQKLRRALRAATLIQRWYRATLHGNYVRQEFLTLRNSTIFLQRCWRRRLLSNKLLLVSDLARKQRALKRITAASRIQIFWRSYCLTKKTRKEFLIQRKCTIFLQCCWRRRLLANKLLLVADLALKQRELKKITAASRIQTFWRSYCLTKKTRKEFLIQRKCTIILQRCWRRRLLSNKLLLVADVARKQRELKRITAASRIQAFWRSYRITKLTREKYLIQRQSVLVIQRQFRANKLMQQEKYVYYNLRCAVITIQRHYRATKLRNQQRDFYVRLRSSVIKMQQLRKATLKMRIVRMEFVSLKQQTLFVQQKFRSIKQMRVESANFQRLKATTIYVQQIFRAKLKMRYERERYLQITRAVVTVQRIYRANKQMRYWRAKYQGTCTAVVCIQQYWRSYLLMKEERKCFLQKRYAARALQNAFRAKRAAKLARDAYIRKRAIVIKLQLRYRAVLMGRHIRNDFKTKRMGIVKIQRFFRAYFAMKCERNAYQLKRAATVKLQRWYRSIVLMRQTRASFQLQRLSCIIVQRRWRAKVAGRQQRQLYLHTIQIVLQIQRIRRATIMMRVECLQFQRQKHAAIVLQRRFRAQREMRKIRSQYLLIHSLIVCIQRKFRAKRTMQKCRYDFLLLKQKVAYVQQKWRGRKQMRIERHCFQLLRRSCVDFQANARGLLARKLFQARMTPEMIMLSQRKKAARVIQRFWRGYRIRKRFISARFCLIRKNVKLLRKASSALKTVRFKVEEAVRVLHGRFIASDAIRVLRQLDRLSRTVPHLLMDHSDFISTFCYGIMAQTIRSEVDKHLIEHCSRVILNLARYNSTTANTFQEYGLVTIAQMLLRWCDKDCEIFNTLCTLIWIFAHDMQKREIIRNFMTTPDAIYVIRETKKLVARKEKMRQNVRKPTVPIVQQQQEFSSRALPNREPDYGIKHNKPYIFISSVYAFDTILSKLGIEIY